MTAQGLFVVEKKSMEAMSNIPSRKVEKINF